MEKKINVLSLFDGCSGGHQALERAGIDVDTYYASEIDKYAIQVTMANYPGTIQLGSVVDINALELPKIDLLLGGSPCQSFSFAGKRKGMSTKDEQEILTLQHYLQLKSEGYEFEGQSYLFWEYMRILEELRVKNPNILFLLENVEMGAKWEKVLSNAIGVRGIHINSALVSAQNRKRIYWINWGMKPSGLFGDMESIIEQPKDRGILLKDILQDNPNPKYFISNKMEHHLNTRDNVKIKNRDDKSGTITVNGEGKQGNNSTFVCESVEEKYFLSEKMINGFERHKERHNEKGTGFGYVAKNEMDKGNSLRANAALCPTDNMLIVHNTMPQSSTTGKGGTGPLSRNDGKTYCLDTGNTNAVEIVLTSKDKRLKQTIDENNLIDGEVKALDVYNQSIHDRYPTLKDPKHNDRALFDGSRIRRLTPIECERLQTVADNYTASVSDSQRYKMLGNGWTIEVISYLFKHI
jgi:DNA (cytosine-5)-methyltransferase 3A